MTGLRTRKPTGQIAYPFLMVEGIEKSGKSHLALSLAGSERVGRTFVFELGERTADEYAALGNYEIVDHNGTYSDLLEQARAVVAEPSDPARPNVAVIDSDSMLWTLLKDAASQAARSSKRAVAILKDDPDADIETTMTYWTKAKDKWWAFHNLFRGWPGITVLTVRAGEVTKVVNGQPVAGQTEWSREVEKGTPYAMTGIVRARFPRPPLLVEVQSLSVEIPRGGLELPSEGTLEHLIFDVLGAGGGFEQTPVVMPTAGIPQADAKNNLWAEACGRVQPKEAALKVAQAAWHDAGLDGRPEVTEAEYLSAVALLPDPATSPTLPQDSPGGDPGADPPQDTPEAQERLQGAASPPTRDRLDEIIADVAGKALADVKGQLTVRGLDPGGRADAIRRRLAEAIARDEGVL